MTGGMWILVFPVAVEEGAETWQRWLGISDVQPVAENTTNGLYQQFGWPSTLLAVAATLWWWFHWYPPRWFRHLRKSRRSVAAPKTHSGTNPMRGIEELERCQQALVKYMAIPAQRMAGSAHNAGSAELYPYMVELCRILDDQGIPHPEIDYHLEIVDTGVWSRFLGDLWAVRHDIERARRVYSGSRP